MNPMTYVRNACYKGPLLGPLPIPMFLLYTVIYTIVVSYYRNIKNVLKLSERELSNNSKSSWHDQYKDSAWVFVGGLPYDLTEGDIICVFSQ